MCARISRPPSQVTSNSIIAQSLLCAPVTHPDLSGEIDGERWLLSFLLSLPPSSSLSLPLSFVFAFRKFTFPLFVFVPLNYFIFVFNFILNEYQLA